jgi:FolB domain-containing protein
VADRIHIRDLSLRTIIGVHDWERKDRQDVVLQLTLEADLSRPAATDDFEDAVDYRAVTKAVIEHVEASHFRLLERLAATVAELTLERFPAVSAVTVTVDKPGALRFTRSVAVELRRERGA